MKRKLAFLTMDCVFIATSLSSCSAYDLGSEGNYYFDINPNNVTNPTWEGGISLIVEKKCATCHTAENPWYKPMNVDTNANSDKLKKIINKDFWVTSSIMPLIKECLEATCGVEKVPMPPKYATPLSKSEKESLLNFVKKLVPASTVGLSSSFTQCSGCHGTNGEGLGTFPKLAKTTKSEGDFKAIVRNGKSDTAMGAYTESKYSDADLTSDYNVLKNLP